MTQTLKLEISVGNIGEGGVISSTFATTEYVQTELNKKVNLTPEGKVDHTQLPDYTYIAGLPEAMEDERLLREEAEAATLSQANTYSDQKLSETAAKKADLVEGKIPYSQLPYGLNLEQNLAAEFVAVRSEIKQTSDDLIEQIATVDTTLRTYVDSKDSDRKDYIDRALFTFLEDLDLRYNEASTRLQGEVDAALLASEAKVDEALLSLKKGETVKFVKAISDAIGGYPLHARIGLDNGDIVRSTVANNTVNPNVDMTGWVKVNAASQILDKNNRSQQDINDDFVNAVSNGIKNDGTTNIATALTNLANGLNDGETIYLPRGTYYFDAENTTKAITKNINIVGDGVTLLVKPNPNSSPSIEFKSSEVIQYSGTGILNSLTAFDPVLQVKGAPLINPCDYYVVLTSTETLIHRAGFSEDYKKEITLDIIDNTYRLRAPSPITFNDLSKLTVRFVKKQAPSVISGIKVKTTTQLPTDGYLFQYAMKYGMITDRVVWDMQDTNSVGVLVMFTRCCALEFKQSGCIGANRDEGTSYPFLNSGSSHIKFERCFYRDSGNAIKNGRAYIARHGYFVEFESCLFSGVDDHYGWDYFVRNMQMSKGIGFCGGSLTVENCYSSDILVNLREDTPYADGTLKIRNSFGRTHTLKAYGHTAPTALTGDFTKHKVWDVIDIDFDLYSDQMSNSAVVIKEPYTGQTDVYRNTIINIKVNFTQRLGIYRVLLDIWLQQNNSTGVEIAPFAGDLASKKLFSQVNIDAKHNKIIDESTANTTDLIRGAVADEHNFKCNDLHFINVRGGVLNTYDSQFKDSKYANAMSNDVSEVSLNNTQFKASAKNFWLQKISFPNTKVYLDNCRAPNQNIFWTVFGDNIEYSKSIFEDESWKAANTWNLRNYRKGMQYEHTLASDLVIGANSYSSIVTFTWTQATKNDFKVASFYIPIGQVRIEIVNNGDLFDYQTAFRLFNTTGSSVTVPAGTKIRFKTA